MIIHQKLSGGTALVMLGLSLLMTGCGDKEESTNTVPPPRTSAPDGAKLDAASLNLEKLENHTNPVVSNNAKQLIIAFERNDYSKAAFALSTIASIRLDSASENVVQAALRQLSSAAGLAEAAGDENAKFAMAHLKETFGQ